MPTAVSPSSSCPVVSPPSNTVKRPGPTNVPFRINNDELGKLIQAAVQDFLQSPTWETFVNRQQVTSADMISARVREADHPAQSYLQHLRTHGVPVPMQQPPWMQQRKNEVITRGCHESANKEAFLRKEFWTILPYRLIKNMRDLRLSPLGVVPQRDRRPRLIVDLSSYSVNQDWVPIAPDKAMQFGRALQRILQHILLVDPRYGPVYLAKVDISDGFYRIALAPQDAPKLAVMLPIVGDEDPMVATPFVLPIGWQHLPPFFSAVTETGADLMNRELNRGHPQPPHRLESYTFDTSPSPPTAPTGY